MQPIANYINVFFDAHSTCAFDQLNEKEYILNVLQELQIQLGNNFDNFYFILFSSNGEGRNPATTDQSFPGKKKVLFYLSDESGKTADELKSSFHCIFKSYLPYTTDNNIYPFPLGHVNNVCFEPREIKSMATRRISAFFSGNLNINRIDFYKQFYSLPIPTRLLKQLIKLPFIKKCLVKKIRKEFIPHSFMNFTAGFKQGLSTQEYKQYLLNSKIVFCPKGFISAETFRHMEAMSAGCIIISEKLPQTSLYKDSPIIQIDDWQTAISITSELLKNSSELEQLQKRSMDFWSANYRPDAVAKYIAIHL
jgi:hypothetical protein